MSSDPFELLGLDRATATDADVRRAYAAKLKVTRPEDDRAGFMALRAAFEYACASLRWDLKIEDENEEDEHSEDDEGHDGEINKEEVYDFDPNEGYPRQPLVDQVVETLEMASANGENIAQAVRELMARPEYSGLDELKSIGGALRHYLCQATGINRGVPLMPVGQHSYVFWMRLWPFEEARPTDRWPRWLKLEVLDELERHFLWTSDRDHTRASRLENDWLAQVGLELMWEDLPAGQASFHRFSRVAKDPYIAADPALLATIIQACPKGAEAEEESLSENFRQLVLAETGFGRKSQVSDIPKWLKLPVYDALAHRFGWENIDKKLRNRIGREKMILRDLSLKRPKHTPDIVRKTAWLQLVREEIVWSAKPLRERYRRLNDNYIDEHVRQYTLIHYGVFALIVVAMFVIPFILYLLN